RFQHPYRGGAFPKQADIDASEEGILRPALAPGGFYHEVVLVPEHLSYYFYLRLSGEDFDLGLYLRTAFVLFYRVFDFGEPFVDEGLFELFDRNHFQKIIHSFGYSFYHPDDRQPRFVVFGYGKGVLQGVPAVLLSAVNQEYL